MNDEKSKRNINIEEWGIWQERSCPMLLVLTLNPAFKELREYLGSCFANTPIIFEPDVNNKNTYMAKWLYRHDEWRSLGQKMLDMLMCPGYWNTFNTGVEVAISELSLTATEIMNSYTNYSLEEAVNKFQEFSQLYYNFYKYGWFTEPIQSYTEYLLRKHITNQSALFLSNENANESSKTVDDNALNDVFRVLMVVKGESFVIEILRDMANCAKVFDSHLYSDKTLQDMVAKRDTSSGFEDSVADYVFSSDATRFADLKVALKEHSDKYYWKNNNYYATQYVSDRDVLIELMDGSHFDVTGISSYYVNVIEQMSSNRLKNLDQKANTLGRLSPYYQNVVTISNLVGSELHDRRKKYIMLSNSAFDALLSVIANKTGTQLDDIHMLIPQELTEFINKPKDFAYRISERKKMFLCLQTDFPTVSALVGDSIEGINELNVSNWSLEPMLDPFIAEGEQAERALDDLDYNMNLFTNGVHVLRGTTAYYDKDVPVIEGIVRVIKDPTLQHIIEGEILVAPSTTPDYYGSILKSKAIVTNLAGMITHAAIVAGELCKPCVVGTNIAAEVLRTGQLIRIDFSKGSVEIVKGDVL